MAQQLIFTSAVAGLNPGSSGYCTVARSESMREAVASRLEQWSVYAHAARGPRPVVCAHRILNLRGSNFHVLTRIVDSGLDYTGRTNFLAHHVVLQPHEIHGACSPAEVFSNWKGWLAEWEGAPRYLDDTSFSLHSIPRTTRMPASAWAEAAGDAGAAALLLTNGAGQAVAKSVDLIVPASFEKGLLRLYAESLYLTDPEGGNAPIVWAVPFTTFLQVENDPADFRWRGLWPEDRGRAIGGVLCDFVNGHIPPIAGGLLTDYARTGTRKTMSQASPNLENAMFEAKQGALLTIAAVSTSNRRTARRSGTRTLSSGTPAASSHGAPRWVWISLLCGVPLGVIAGSLITLRPSGVVTSSSKPTTIIERTTTPRPAAVASSAAQTPMQHEPAVDAPTQERRMRNLILSLENQSIEDRASDLNNVKMVQLERLQSYTDFARISDAELSSLEANVQSLIPQIDSSNRALEASKREANDRQALDSLPKGTVYVLSGSTRTALLTDPRSPLQEWLKGLANGTKAESLYRARFQYDGISENDSKPQPLLFAPATQKLGCVSPPYDFAANKIEYAGSGNPPDTILISFIPDEGPNLVPFTIDVAAAKPKLEIDRSTFETASTDPLQVQLRPEIYKALSERLSGWKDEAGRVLHPFLAIHIKGEPAATPDHYSDSGLTFDLGSLRQPLLNQLAEMDRSVEVANRNVTVATERKKAIEDSRTALCNLPASFSKKTLDSIGNPANLDARTNGRDFYSKLGQWILRICNGNIDDANKILPENATADKRVDFIVAVSGKLRGSVETHPSQKDSLNAFAADLSRVPWAQYSEFLSDDEWSVSAYQKTIDSLHQLETSREKVKAALASMPDRTKIDQLWIEANLAGSPTPLIGIAGSPIFSPDQKPESSPFRNP